MTLEALRLEVGDDDFSAIIHRWARSRAGGHGTTKQFIRIAEDVSGKQLDDLFETWLYTPKKPVVPAALRGRRSVPPRLQRSSSGSTNSTGVWRSVGTERRVAGAIRTRRLRDVGPSRSLVGFVRHKIALDRPAITAPKRIEGVRSSASHTNAAEIA